MTDANDLISRFERETGQRIDDNDGDNMAMAGLLGAVSRIMGQASHNKKNDVNAGVLIKHRLSPEYKAEHESKELIATMLTSGMSPDDVKKLMG